MRARCQGRPWGGLGPWRVNPENGVCGSRAPQEIQSVATVASLHGLLFQQPWQARKPTLFSKDHSCARNRRFSIRFFFLETRLRVQEPKPGEMKGRSAVCGLSPPLSMCRFS